MKVNHIMVFGAGAAGANTLLNLVHVHPDLSFSLIDFDNVELRNIEAGTQPYSKADLNRPKVQAMQRIVQSARGKRISTHCARMNFVRDIVAVASNINPNGNFSVDPFENVLLIDAFDNTESRNLFLELKKWVHVLHIGFSQKLNGEAVWAESFSKMEKSRADAAVDVCQMHLARPFIMALTAMASMVVSEFVESGIKRSLYFDRTLKTFTF